MEHSYSRDSRPIEGANGLTTRTLMVHRPPQCPSCHSHPIDEGIDLDEANHPPIPSYNETAAKEAMDECTRVANSVRNLNSDDENWEERINKTGWTLVQERLFARIARVLDMDHLARLATNGRQHEPVQRRVIIDRSVDRVRQALASVSWEPKLTQWIHGILMDNLPPTYMASYLDILQTLKTKLPTLMDKMLFGRPMNVNQELLTPVMKKQWDPIVSQKNRKIPANCVIVIVPSTALTGPLPSRLQKWYQLFSTIAPIVQINPQTVANALHKQPIDQVAEHIVSISRAKIQELRTEQPSRHIILIGFNAGAALALQIALAENVNSIVCMGFAYNTVNGVRGAPDDHILDITTPIMFVIGQNSARSSQEEIESLREKMQSQTSLVVVGSADDALRVPKNKRRIDNVTQSMVDNMVTDEIYEFIRNCITNPPGPRQPTNNISYVNTHDAQQTRVIAGGVRNPAIRKRKQSQGSDTEALTPAKSGKFIANRQTTIIGRPRTRPLITTASAVSAKQKLISQPSPEVLNMAIQSILPDDDKNTSQIEEIGDDGQMMQYEIISQPKLEIRQTSTGAISNIRSSPMVVPMMQRPAGSATGTVQKVKMIPSNQFVQIKPPQANTQKIYTIKTSSGLGSDNLRGQGQIFTVKSTPSGQQYLQGPTTSPLVISPTKYTVLKSATGSSTIVSNESDVQKTTSDLSNTNIFDIPIIFADNDGNIHDTSLTGSGSNTASTLPSTSSTPSASQIIITSQPHQVTGSEQTPNVSQAKSFILNTAGTLQKPKANKVVFINRNTMKPCPNIISKSVPPLKYAKVVVTNPKTSTPSLVTRPAGPHGSGDAVIDKPMTTVTIQKPGLANIIKTSSGQITTSNQSSAQQTVIGTMQNLNKQFQPIIINVDSDKTTIKNMIKVGDSTSQMKPTILLKPGGLKSIPVLKPGILNRNVTVRKVVNLVQGKPTITATISPATGQSGEIAKTIVVSSATGQIVAASSAVSTSTAAASVTSTSSSGSNDAATNNESQ